MSDLTLATRELFERTVHEQVFMRSPVIEKLLKRNKVTYSGGKTIDSLVDTAEMTELGQAYTPNTALTDEKKDFLAKPSFSWKYYQMPMKYGVDEYTQNITAGDEEQLLDLAAFLVKKGQRGIKLALERMIFNVDPETNTGSETGTADGSKFFQSLLSALDHDVTTYGGLSRTFASATNGYWHGADPEGAYLGVTTSSQGTAYNISMSNIRKWVIPIREYMETPSDLYIMMCPSLFNKFRAEYEARVSFKAGDTQGSTNFDELQFDKYTLASIPYMENGGSGISYMYNWVFMLNLADWELRIHNKRNFEMTEFTWQGDRSNGYDAWLARIMLVGNFICWKPNGSMYLQEVS